jgi:hypothetical protein
MVIYFFVSSLWSMGQVRSCAETHALRVRLRIVGPQTMKAYLMLSLAYTRWTNPQFGSSWLLKSDWSINRKPDVSPKTRVSQGLDIRLRCGEPGLNVTAPLLSPPAFSSFLRVYLHFVPRACLTLFQRMVALHLNCLSNLITGHARRRCQ